MNFDPNDTATADSGLFGLPFSAADSRLHLIPVPWEVTTSYGDGASRGPRAILRASHQVDLFDLETGDAYRNGYHMLPIPKEIEAKNREFKTKAKRVLEAIEAGRANEPAAAKLRGEINQASREVNDWVYIAAKRILAEKRVPAVIGGDHSTPYGLIRATSENLKGDFSILHIDAHADLRENYQGYEHSHASIMFNVMKQLNPKSLVQVGIRDFSSVEYELTESDSRITTFFDQHLKRRLHRGENWQALCEGIVAKLDSKNVHISFDIDGLTPELCPSTGTPVPGGLSFEQVLTLIATVVEQGKRIVSFDLNEVAEAETNPSDWDGNVGARVLYKLCGWTMISNGLKPSTEKKKQ